jgi:hypothetical protein
MHLRALVLSSLSFVVLAPLGCGARPDGDAFDTVQQGQDNGGTSSPDRCTVSRDSTGETLGEGTVDANGFCCVPKAGGQTTCYACGSGFTCASLPNETPKPPRKPPIAEPPVPPIVKG